MTIFIWDALIWAGACLSLIGVGLLLWCVAQALSARRAGLEEPALRARLQRLIAYNLGALALSSIGLMMVVLGIILS